LEETSLTDVRRLASRRFVVAALKSSREELFRGDRFIFLSGAARDQREFASLAVNKNG